MFQLDQAHAGDLRASIAAGNKLLKLGDAFKIGVHLKEFWDESHKR